MQLQIGVMGSSARFSDEDAEKARLIGKEIARNNCTMITGGGLGLPLEAAKAARDEGGLVVGISPAADREEHRKVYGLQRNNFDTLIYTGFGYAGRNVINIHSCDGVIFMKGEIGTLDEFAQAFRESLVIGILENDEGIVTLAKDIEKICRSKKKAEIICYSDPEVLVQEVIKYLINKKVL